MTQSIYFYLILGTSLMVLLSLYLRKMNGFTFSQSILSMIFLTISGVIGAYFMFYLENGAFGGISYFGAVLFAPIFMFVFNIIIKSDSRDLLNLCAPAECLMLSIMKFHCLVHGCCAGSELYNAFIFIPLQVVESLIAIVVMILLIMIYKHNRKQNIYAWYLVIYGIVRFILNCFRDNLCTFLFLPSIGHFWALLSIMIGMFMNSKSNLN